MIKTVADAVVALGVDEFAIHGEPTNETEFNEMFKKSVGDDGNGGAILSSDPDDFGCTWTQVSTKLTELQTAEDLRELRQERNRKLVETDFYALSDNTMSTEMTTYRQALRDITDTYSSLDTVVWPTKP